MSAPEARTGPGRDVLVGAGARADGVGELLDLFALGDGLRVAMGATDGSLGLPALVLVLWAAVGSVLAVRSFRWD